MAKAASTVVTVHNPERNVRGDGKHPTPIKPAMVQAQAKGSVYHHWLLRVPPDWKPDDLKLNGSDVWSKLQASISAFKKLDNVRVVAHDESWLADCIVADSGASFVQLAVGRLVDLEKRTTRLFEDDTYRIVWSGRGYFVERKSDKQRMSGDVGNEVLAIRELKALYPMAAA